MTTRTTTTPDQVRHAKPPGPLVAEILAVLQLELGRAAGGRVIDHVALDVGRARATEVVYLAVNMR
jgi:hypothetical protein